MSAKAKPKQPKCTKICLRDEKDTSTFLDIAPTMANITYQGRRYFKCPDSRGQDTDGQWGMLYLWDGWGAWRMAQFEAAKNAGEASP